MASQTQQYPRILPTFSEYRAEAARHLPLDDTGSIDLMWTLYSEEIANRIDDLMRAPDLPASPEAMAREIALSCIRDHLGVDWYERNVARVLERGRSDPPLVRLLRLSRAITLGRSLYEMQSYEWFDSIVKKLAHDSFTGVTFELEVMSMLQKLPALSSAQVETTTQGVKSFDIVAYYDRTRIPIEVKAKGDTTPWRAQTVIDTLKKAARQLPEGGQGVVFLRIPPGWVGPRLEEEYPDALDEGTRQSSRIEAVFTVIDKPHLSSASTGNVHQVYDCFRRSVPQAEAPWQLCLLLKQILEGGWAPMGPVAPF